ncbi:hypothetical protein LUZ60_003698 [Juncus effusus]|nr:hypothetical protein LUZ60_003698 [Juncus effusus]
MLVQDRVMPKPADTPRRRNFAKNLDFATWASENSYKVIAAVLVISSVAALFFLRNSGDSAALLCFEKSTSAKSAASRIQYPHISWSNVAPIRPLGPSVPYSSFRSEKWIVVSVSSPPTDALRALVRMKGWQLVAVGNSETPDDWALKGAIFLSLEQQALLGFRSVDYLPYNSYVRKTIGYLFAIQHGAKIIFDVDDRAEVLESDLSRSFDVDLVAQKHPVLLQYSHADPNRTVINPYIHFGQRSVWPRGLPLDRVGDVAHEEFYTEIFGGKQFIQQGLSNGLPDVDAVFYHTRKSSGLESFDIRFDEDAPKVALPQGMMAPVNSFNTLFHTQAFWGLMLPVSISSMASDVIRGYFAQRILWEIGGFVTIHPPTLYRPDKAGSYHFSEEKDLHVNVNRLINFLIEWRSSRRNLFERILELSVEMAERGFWGEEDVKMTAAWLQDLVSVGYQQPRLMALELDRTRASIGHGDKKEFVPKKLPSIHLGVEETGVVNFEIGNLIRWRKHFGNVVLIMHLSGPIDRTALEWRLLYGRIFKTVIILAEQGNWDLAVEKCSITHAYKHLPKVFERYSGAEGFLFLQDTMILNYWNLLQADKTKLWITDKVKDSWFEKQINSEEWFLKQGQMVKQVVSNFPVHFQTSYKESMKDDDKLTFSTGEIFYVPGRFVGDFTDLVGLVGNLDIHHKIAVPMFFLSMDSPQNFDSDVLAKTVYKINLKSNETFMSFYTAQAPTVFPVKVQNEVDFVKLIRLMASGDPLLMELV